MSYMGYDQVGNQVLAKDEKLNETTFTFDLLNRTTHVEDALSGVTYMGYDSRSSAVLRVDADGRATYMAYDPARRLERQWFANPVAGESADSPIYYTYDQVGNLLTSDDSLAGLGTTVQEFDKLDRLTKKVTVAGAVYYSYDLSGMKRSFKDADLKENYYVFDAAGRLEREVLDAGRTAYFFHDDAGLVTKRLAPVIASNSLMTYMSYDDAGRLKQQEGYARLGGVTGLVTYFSCQRNPNGQPTWIRNEDDENTYYEYDALDRLTLEERKSGSATLYGFRYAFDEASNRTRKVTLHESDARTYFTYDARNLLDREWVDGGEAAYYTHDSAQRMKRREVTGTGQSAYFTHDQRQQVTRIDFAKASSADSPATFAYSGTGEAVIAGDNGETTYWQHDGRRLALERLDSTKSAVRRYRNNGPLVEYQEGGGPFQLAFDGEGAVRKGVSPLEDYVPGNFLTSKFGVPLIQTDALRDGRVKWGGSGVLKLNALNETIYLLGAGGCFLPGPGRITIPLGGSGAPGRGFGWHNQVSIVDRGDEGWGGVSAQERPGGPDLDGGEGKPACPCAARPTPPDCRIEVKWLAASEFSVYLALGMADAQLRDDPQNVPRDPFGRVLPREKRAQLQAESPDGTDALSTRWEQQMRNFYRPAGPKGFQFLFSSGPALVRLLPREKAIGCHLVQVDSSQANFPVFYEGQFVDPWNYTDEVDIAPEKPSTFYEGWRYVDWPRIPYTPRDEDPAKFSDKLFRARWYARVYVRENPDIEKYWGYAGSAQYKPRLGGYDIGAYRWVADDRWPHILSPQPGDNWGDVPLVDDRPGR